MTPGSAWSGDESWIGFLDTDPRPWLLASDEPAARWVALTDLLDRPEGDPEVAAAHAAVVSDVGTRGLIARLPAWGVDTGVSGHSSPGYAPNLLHLLADMGIGPGDDERVDALLDEMLEHQDAAGGFLFYARGGHGSRPVVAMPARRGHRLPRSREEGGLLPAGGARGPANVRSPARLQPAAGPTGYGPGLPPGLAEKTRAKTLHVRPRAPLPDG